MNEAGIGFMMSPKYHPAMKIVSPVRKKLKIKTIFNILGPMLNPASVPFAVVGVFHEDLVSHCIMNRNNCDIIIYPTNFAYWSSYVEKITIYSYVSQGYSVILLNSKILRY